MQTEDVIAPRCSRTLMLCGWLLLAALPWIVVGTVWASTVTVTRFDLFGTYKLTQAKRSANVPLVKIIGAVSHRETFGYRWPLSQERALLVFDGPLVPGGSLQDWSSGKASPRCMAFDPNEMVVYVGGLRAPWTKAGVIEAMDEMEFIAPKADYDRIAESLLLFLPSFVVGYEPPGLEELGPTLVLPSNTVVLKHREPLNSHLIVGLAALCLVWSLYATWRAVRIWRSRPGSVRPADV